MANGIFTIDERLQIIQFNRAAETQEASLIFEKMLTHANHLGLYAEEIARAARPSGTCRRPSPTWR